MTRILITGAAGGIGQALLREMPGGHEVLATDIRRPALLPDGAGFETLDVRGDDVERVIGDWNPEVVVHLASIVTPPKGSARAFEHAVDVEGSRKVIDACVAHGVRRIVVTSSGAAYGYHADNPVPLRETDALRGNEEFAYAFHKRLVEEMLAEARRDHPALEQVVLRVGTVLGKGIENQITALFRRDPLLGIIGSDSPFVFIWTRDLARILLRAATDGPPGIYNVAGDGALGTRDLAAALDRKVRWLSPSFLKLALGVAHPLGLSRYGPEQVRFLQYRPVLDNTKLKAQFGYVPDKTSAEVFALWREGAGL
ncbi:SDR family oxidoreductase [Oricola sp.]|uniref:SDR family oxidoreductase n=1 Tax=Oricola sp. TaxID=1979950 RepID=UPI0025ED6989|nr:SDR family oxidoreductase [Oricola sp.]MCI5077881.1 SDR family oxidoreductase [Oricola sp.]